MPASRLTVIVTRRLPEAVETRMKELFDVELRDPDVAMTREELANAMRRADVLVPTITDTIDAGLLAQAGEKLKLIANYGAGVDHIDVATARNGGIAVWALPYGYNMGSPIEACGPDRVIADVSALLDTAVVD